MLCSSQLKEKKRQVFSVALLSITCVVKKRVGNKRYAIYFEHILTKSKSFSNVLSIVGNTSPIKLYKNTPNNESYIKAFVQVFMLFCVESTKRDKKMTM